MESRRSVCTAVRENRAFLGRAVRYLAEEAGIRRFLDIDIGSGLPSAGNVHEVAQSVAPDSRVVYVDNDPMVLVHANALLTGALEGHTAFIRADLRERPAGDFARLAFAGLDLVEPGVELVSEWRPEGTAPRPTAAEVSWFGGVARKP
jgi:hypothetical protein